MKVTFLCLNLTQQQITRFVDTFAKMPSIATKLRIAQKNTSQSILFYHKLGETLWKICHKLILLVCAFNALAQIGLTSILQWENQVCTIRMKIELTISPNPQKLLDLLIRFHLFHQLDFPCTRFSVKLFLTCHHYFISLIFHNSSKQFFLSAVQIVIKIVQTMHTKLHNLKCNNSSIDLPKSTYNSRNYVDKNLFQAL